MAATQSQHVIEHINEVQNLGAHRDTAIRQSWQRCLSQYQMDPTRLQEAVVLPSDELKNHQEEMQELMMIARVGIEALYQQIYQIKYVVLLTNAQGVTVDYIGDRTFDNQLRKSGLYLGADWNEARAGTCAVGTCIEEQAPIIVHQTDHFDATHIPLTCSAAPIHSPDGALAGVLDISALMSPRVKDSQHMALNLVKIFATRIENSHFMSHFRNTIIVRLSRSVEFLEVAPEFLIALDDAGAVIGFSQSVKQELTANKVPLGYAIDKLLESDLETLMSQQYLPAHKKLVKSIDSQQALFFQMNFPERQIVKQRPVPTAIVGEHQLAPLHGGDSTMVDIERRVEKLINSRVNLLITGETGTGKEYLANAIHSASLRADKPFVAINCAAIPESLIESELFGYDQGAFTGSRRGGKAGLIEQANGGTLFLDEIGDMPLMLQSRLLRVLAEKEVQALGSVKKVRLDLHVLSATHCDLQQKIEQGEFRADLYYRLNGSEIRLPALRERQDFNWLLEQLVVGVNASDSDVRALVLNAEIQAHLAAYPWPGNIRELKNILSYLKAICGDMPIRLSDLPERHQNLPHPPVKACLDDKTECSNLEHLLRTHHWNVSAVARALGVSRMTIYRRMKREALVAPNQL